ncbi:hypothetical protein C8J56DRAFT_1054651 [Mycena floridula]|nr:hypothetical protein C8J56DRAFT_1054651 [Mycena floridula]
MVSPQNNDTAPFVVGPFLIGSHVDLLFMGILASQIMHYFNWYKDDHRSMRLVVLGLFIINIFKSIQTFTVVWIMATVNFGNMIAILLGFVNAWWQYCNPLFVAISSLYVQAFFCHRLYVLTKKWFIVVPIVLVLAVSFLSVCVSTHFIRLHDTPNTQKFFTVHLVCVFVADILLTSSTVFFLLRAKKRVFKQTSGILDALIRLTFQSAAPAALCTMLNLILNLAYNRSTISSAVNIMIPKFYAMSMMWTLNQRLTIRIVNTSRGGTSNESVSQTQRAGTRFTRSTRQADNIELDPMSIQVVTHKENVQHIDMYNQDASTSKGDDFKAKSISV